MEKKTRRYFPDEFCTYEKQRYRGFGVKKKPACLILAACASPDNLGQQSGFPVGGSGSSMIEFRRFANWWRKRFVRTVFRLISSRWFRICSETWSRKFGPGVKVDRIAKETIRNDQEKDAYA
jgi:hypothetical protein